MFYFVLVIVLVASLVIVFDLLFNFVNCIKGYAPNISSTKSAVIDITKIYNFSTNQKVADYGSGYGEILWKLKDLPISITGYEINPVLYLFLKLRLKNYKNIKIEYKNFLQENPNKFDVVIIYGVMSVMKQLEERLLKEDIKNLVIISNKFKFKKIDYSKKLGDIYVYEL